ncbi:MAG TPA: DUF3667 domain-containing protein [Burkholderiaceae bacterium]
MSGIEIPAEVVSEAVLAHAIGKSLDGGNAAPAAQCANCGATLSGRYCVQCGQPAHVHRSLLHMFEELLHGIFHFETKAWRTLPLLALRPGRLTREYIDGRRARYVSPLPLFLFMMFAMFMSFSLTSSNDSTELAQAMDGAPKFVASAKKQKQWHEELEKAQAELAELPASDPGRVMSQALISKLEARLAAAEAASNPASAASAAASSAREENEPQVTQEEMHEQLQKRLPWLATPSFERKLMHVNDNKELALYKIKNGAAKFAILLVPITLPFLWLLFIFRRDVKMFDHAVFAFYSLSAMALLMSLLAVFGHLGLEFLTVMLAIFAPPLHLFAQFRGTYALSRFGAAWRTLAMSLFAGVALAAYGLIVVALSM